MFDKFSTVRYRWIALVFLSLALAIIIIDNTVLNVAIPYILRDLNTSLEAIQWVISGYALIIAMLLITVGRLGDLWGRKRIFLLGTIFFAVGSFIASISKNAQTLFLGEAFIEAIGAAMMMTSSLSLLASEFTGKERAIAFGIWGSVAGIAASIGPLLGGYLTSYYSWRWSLRINVGVALIAILGSIFIKETLKQKIKHFDWLGVFLSGAGLFSLVFGFIEGRTYGWWKIQKVLSLANWQWPLDSISIIPFFFTAALIIISLFILHEYRAEKKGDEPLLRISTFKNRDYSYGLFTLGIISLGQFGTFFILPIFLQTVLGYNAFQSGLTTIPSSIAILIFGPTSGFLASRIGPKWLVNIGMFVLAAGEYLLIRSLNIADSGWSLTPSLAIFGIGVGLTSSQLTNLILSSVSVRLAGEASAVNSTIRQVGTSIGVAVIGTIFAGTLAANIITNINNEKDLPFFIRDQIILRVQDIDPEAGQQTFSQISNNQYVSSVVAKAIEKGIVDSAKRALYFTLFFTLAGAVFSLFIPDPGKKLSTLDKPDISDKTKSPAEICKPHKEIYSSKP